MIDAEAVLAYDFGETEQSYDERDAILYALGAGLGRDAVDARELRFLDERSLRVLPTYAVTLCSPGMWIRDPSLGVDFGKLVHFAQRAEFMAPLPPRATVRGTAKVVSLTDRGEGKGAVLVLERTISDASTGARYCRLHQTLLLRGDGGFGGEPAIREPKAVLAGDPIAKAHFAVSPRAALIYRLSGDWNPLHLDPAFAAAAGFDRPILQGLASYAAAGIAVSEALQKDVAELRSLGCRFSGIVLPGDDLTFLVWTDGAGGARFSAKVGDRLVLDGGVATWQD